MVFSCSSHSEVSTTSLLTSIFLLFTFSLFVYSPASVQGQSNDSYRTKKAQSKFINAHPQEPEFLQQKAENVPEPGEVYTSENIEEIYPWLPKFFPHIINTWKGQHSELKIKIGETEHVEFPNSYVQATKDLSEGVSLSPDGRLSGYKAGMPFPSEKMIGEGYDTLDEALKNNREKAGYMILYNFFFKARANAREALFATLLVDRHGNRQFRAAHPIQVQHNHRTANYPEEPVNPHEMGVNFKYLSKVDEPAAFKDIAQLQLMPDFSHNYDGTIQVYSYLPSLRRVVPQSGVGSAHCAPVIGTDYYVDDLFTFSGNISWFNVKYLGRAELLYPFDPESGKFENHPSPTFEQNFTKGGLPARLEWQLRPVYVLELTPKAEHDKYCYPKRRIYLGAETYWGLSMEVVDKNMEPWKMTISSPGPVSWKPESSEVYYGQQGTDQAWDFQAKHGTWSAILEKTRAIDHVSSSDLTPSGMLKVIK